MRDFQGEGTGSHESNLEKEVVRLQDEVKRLRRKLGEDTDILDPNQVSVALDQKDEHSDTTSDDKGDSQSRELKAHLALGAESVTDLLRETSDSAIPSKRQTTSFFRGAYASAMQGANSVVLRGSALSKSFPMQVFIYLVAVSGVVFVLIATSISEGAHHEEDGIEAAGGGHGGGHRRLGGDTSPLLKNIAYCLTGCGAISYFVNVVLKQPLILGYLLGGLLVGPLLLKIADQHTVSEIASLGLIFLLFMIGLELDMKELLKMGKTVIFTGMFQFPICMMAHYGIFMGLEAAGLSFGDGEYASLYCAMVCGISSTMIVVKLLSENGETERPNGRLTIGILIFQDIWAIVILAIQPKITNPEILGILRTFLMIAILVIIAVAYAKFVMPAILFYASKSVELMLVLSLAWCFFICCIAILPFMGLSMELAALIAGVALATFPYSTEFNAKIKHIRDFFIVLFFAALGMQIPVPTPEAICTAILIAFIVLLVRWLGIWLIVLITGGGGRLGVLATINLSQISEFALVICSLGMKQTPPHIEEKTMTIIIWTFAILAVAASYLLGNNHTIYLWLHSLEKRVFKKVRKGEIAGDSNDHLDEEDEKRDIVILGFHRIAFMLVAECRAKNPRFLKKLYVIDFNQAIHPKLEERGVKCKYGDISSADVLTEVAERIGEPTLVLCTIPDSSLQGVSNGRLLKLVKQVWPNSHCIVTADNPQQAEMLYAAGADYVVRSAKLCAERVHDLISKYYSEESSELQQLFSQYKKKDKDKKTSFLEHQL